MTVTKKTYVTFVKGQPMGDEHRKTDSWRVDGQGMPGINVLGWIQWYSRWRCYAFQPNMRTVYSAGCLQDIGEFCVKATKEYKASKKPVKYVGEKQGMCMNDHLG